MAGKDNGDLSLTLLSKFKTLMADNFIGDLSKSETLVVDNDHGGLSFPPCTQLGLAKDHLTPQMSAYTLEDLTANHGDSVFEERDKIDEEMDKRLVEESLYKLDLDTSSSGLLLPINLPRNNGGQGGGNKYYSPPLWMKVPADDDDDAISDFDRPFVDMSVSFTKLGCPPPDELARSYVGSKKYSPPLWVPHKVPADGDLPLPQCSKFEKLRADNDVGDLSPPLCSKFVTPIVGIDDGGLSFPPCAQLDLAKDQQTPHTLKDLTAYDGDNIFEEWEKMFEELDNRLLEESLHKLDLDTLKKDSGRAKKRIAPQGQSGTRKKSRSKLLDFMNEENFRCELLIDCEKDLGILFGSVNFFASFLVDQKPHAQSAQWQKVSNLHAALTGPGNEAEMSDAVFEALVDLCRLDNDVILYRSLRVLHRALTYEYPLDAGSNTGVRENIIIERPSKNTAETRVGEDVKVEGSCSEENNEKRFGLQSLGNALPKFGLHWITVFELMSQIATREIEECIRLEAVSIMNLLLCRSKAYGIDRERLRRVLGYQTISQFLQKVSGAADVQIAE